MRKAAAMEWRKQLLFCEEYKPGSVPSGEVWSQTVTCPLCGHRLAVLRDEFWELATDMDEDPDKRWSATCPECYGGLVAEVRNDHLLLSVDY